MYLRNLQITIGKLLVKLNNPVQSLTIRSTACNLFKSTKNNAGFLTLFTLIPLLLLSGCDTSGSVGSEVIPDEELINNIQIDLDDLSLIHAESYSGSLLFTSLGAVDDPVYGNLSSVALLKPSISSATVDTLTEEDTLLLQLIFDSRVYGDENSVSRYDIYEAGEVWRGSQIRYNQSVEVNHSNLIASVEVAASDTTALVELNDSWGYSFSEFFNSTDADSDSLYRQQFPGLAIVPADGTNSMRFLKSQQQSEGEVITSIIVRSPEEEDETEEEDSDSDSDNGDSEEDEDEEETVPTIYFRDWAASAVKNNLPDSEDRIVMSNTSHVLQINPDFSLPDADLSSKNIVNAQLLLYKDHDPEMGSSHISRLSSSLLRAHIFSETPEDIMASIFTANPRYQAVVEEDEDVFKMDVTEFVLNQVFGEDNTQELYLTLQSVNGLFYSNHFFNLTDPERRPKIIITTVE